MKELIDISRTYEDTMKSQMKDVYEYLWGLDPSIAEQFAVKFLKEAFITPEHSTTSASSSSFASACAEPTDYEECKRFVSPELLNMECFVTPEGTSSSYHSAREDGSTDDEQDAEDMPEGELSRTFFQTKTVPLGVVKMEVDVPHLELSSLDKAWENNANRTMDIGVQTIQQVADMQQKIKEAGGCTIKLGDEVVRKDGKFEFHLTTKLPNPNYSLGDFEVDAPHLEVSNMDKALEDSANRVMDVGVNNVPKVDAIVHRIIRAEPSDASSASSAAEGALVVEMIAREASELLNCGLTEPPPSGAEDSQSSSRRSSVKDAEIELALAQRELDLVQKNLVEVTRALETLDFKQ